MQTGLRDLDLLTSGFAPGDLVLLAGRSGSGKSAFALNSALYAARHGEAVAIFSFETTRERIMQRLISTLTSIPFRAMLSDDVSKRDWPKLFLSARNSIWSRLYIVGSANLTIGEMRDTLRVIMRDRARAGKNRLSLVVVDPLQLMVPVTSTSEKRGRHLGTIVVLLKRMARDLGVPVLLVSQLDRNVDDRRSKAPLVSDLEVSEVVESYADKILLLQHDAHSTLGSDDEATAEIIIKQRNGPASKVQLAWRADCGSFSSLHNRSASTDR